VTRPNTGWPVSRDFHPDPLVECARRSITEAGLEQASARGRNVRRNESKPLHEYIITNAPTPRLVDGTFTKAEFEAVVGWVGELLFAGVWVVDGKGQGVLQAIFRGICSQSAYSGVIRPVIPKVSGHPFRFYPAIDSGASGHPVM
jgi:hypothetical protein